MPAWVITVGGTDVSASVPWSSIRIASTGWRGLATASFRVQDLANSIAIAPEAEVIITRDAVREFGGLVRDRGRGIIGSSGKRRYDITCQDFSTRLSDDVATGGAARRRTTETDKARITWLLATWGTKGITVGAEVQQVQASMEPFDFRGLTLAEALDAICEETGAKWYVDAGKRLHYFDSETVAGPFDFSDVPNGTSLRAYSDLSLPDETAGLVNAVWVRGDRISGWRTDAASIAAYGRREGSIDAPRVKTQAQLDRRGDAYLGRHAQPLQSGSLRTWEAGGLRAGMRIRLTNAPWGIASQLFRTQEVELQVEVPDGRAWYTVRFGNGRPTLGKGGGGQMVDDIGEGIGEAVGVGERIGYTAGAGPNLVPNSSAERTPGWVAGSFTIGYVHTDARHGARTFRATPSAATLSQLRSTDFIPVVRARDHWISVWSLMSAHTAGGGRLKVLEYDAAGTLLVTTTFGTIAAVEADWTRHSIRFGALEDEQGPAWHANTTKIKVAADSDATSTFTWDLDAWQVEASLVLTSYLPLPNEIADGIVDITSFASGIRPVSIVSALPALPDATYPEGAVVVLTTDDKLYRSTGTAWTAAVPTVDLTGTITQAQIADAAISTAKFAAGIRPVEILGALPAAGTQGRTVFLTTDNKLYRDTGSAWTAVVPTTDLTGTITQAQIADAAISVAKFAAGLRPVQIVSGALPSLPSSTYPEGATVFRTDDDKLYRSTGPAWTAEVATVDLTGTITSTQITDGAVTTPKLDAGAVTTAKLAAGAVTANEIAADTITAGQIAAGAISTSELAAGAVIASKLAIGDFSNLAEDPGFERWADASTTWAKGAGWAIGTTNPRSGNRAASFTGGTAALRSGNLVDCRPGDRFTVRGWLRGDAANGTAAVRISWLDAAKAEINVSQSAGAASTGAYVEAAVTATAPASAVYARAEFVVSGRTAGTWYADDIWMARIVGTTVIEDGAITTAKVTAGAITTDRLAAGAVTANEIAADTITAGQIAAGAISTSELAAGAVTTAKLAAGAVTANEIAANTITAGQIAADAVTTAALAANAVTAAKIAADTITAGQIAAGAIGASEIAAEAVTAEKLLVGLVGARNLLRNGGFRDGLTGWSFANASSGGTGSAAMWPTSATDWTLRDFDVDGAAVGGPFGSTAYMTGTATAGSWFLYQDVLVTPGEFYSLSALLGNHRLTSAYVYIDWLTAAGVLISSSAISNVIGDTLNGGPGRSTWGLARLSGVQAPATAYTGQVLIAAILPRTSGTDAFLFIDQVMLTNSRLAHAYVSQEEERVRAAAGAVLINQDGVTITNGKLTVQRPGGTTIIDGTSIMYRQFAKGTLTVSATNQASNLVTDTLTAYGTTSVVPAWMGWRADSAAATGGVKVGSLWFESSFIGRAANSSGSGSTHDIRFVAHEYWGELACYLSALPGYPVMELEGRGYLSATYYANYHVLIEATI